MKLTVEATEDRVFLVMDTEAEELLHRGDPHVAVAWEEVIRHLTDDYRKGYSWRNSDRTNEATSRPRSGCAAG